MTPEKTGRPREHGPRTRLAVRLDPELALRVYDAARGHCLNEWLEAALLRAVERDEAARADRGGA